MKALFMRDIQLYWREGGGLMVSLLFSLGLLTLFPFAIGADLQLLSKLAPAILWVSVLLSMLLSLERLFKNDHQDGTLELFFMSEQSFLLLIGVKILAHWLFHALPLIILTPILGLMLNLEADKILGLMVSLVAGTPALSLLGALGAALSLQLKKGGVFMVALILPFTFPTLIFGAGLFTQESLSTPFMLLCALSLISLVVSLPLCALALRHAFE